MKVLGPGFLTLGFFSVLLLLSEPRAAEPEPVEYQRIITEDGLHCVVFNVGKGQTAWGSCNWDEYNFRQWHGGGPPQHPPVKKEEHPI